VCKYKARSRKVYLPATTGWYDLYTGKFIQGNQTIDADAPLNKMPVFVKEGSIVPFGPEIQYSTEKTDGTIILFVYAGKDATFDLYEDENVNYNYEKEKYSVIPVSYNEKSRTLTIGDRKGSFEGMVADRIFQIIYVTGTKAVSLDFSRKPVRILKYNGEKQSVALDN
jgi:alpha-D-xyloside xylohydrolase